jgi:hypothetical protein
MLGKNYLLGIKTMQNSEAIVRLEQVSEALKLITHEVDYLARAEKIPASYVVELQILSRVMLEHAHSFVIESIVE